MYYYYLHTGNMGGHTGKMEPRTQHPMRTQHPTWT